MLAFAFSATFVGKISHSKNWTRCDQKFILQVKYLLFFLYFKETWIFSTDFFHKYSNINFHENTSSDTNGEVNYSIITPTTAHLSRNEAQNANP